MARPTDYSDEIVKKAKAYLGMFDIVDEEQQEVIPTIEGLALFLGISRTTVYAWQKEAGKEEFSYIVEDILAKQAQMLISKGLLSQYAPTIAKVMLTKHGYREGIDQTTNDKDLPTPLLHALRNNDSDKETSETE